MAQSVVALLKTNPNRLNQPTGTGALATHVAHVGRLAHLARMAHVVHLAGARLGPGPGPCFNRLWFS